ncbi:hypothetical protein N431DRAFT_468675 [Stipitochalara longipes BDJ]|nr:hypothetical protein N431DRAFT_468675 [Stipitochalara longipes BDJ]
MLLTRSLPPQFLLPAWSVRQLTQASQRAATSFSTHDDRPPKLKPRKQGPRIFRRLVLDNISIDSNQNLPEDQDIKPESRRPGEPEKEYIFHRTVTADVYSAPQPTKSLHKEPYKSEPISLFDELFPEESQARSRRERAAEKRLDKLPAFKWNSRKSAPIVTDSREQARAARRLKYTSVPEREDPKAEEKAKYTPIRKDKFTLEHLQADLGREPELAALPSVLVLNACSMNLEESDFFRLGPKGNHIEGWTSGILKVIPARDRNTLEKLGHYFILCSDHAAARAFLDRTKALHRLARSQRIMEDSGVPIPPGYLPEGEDSVKLLAGFSLAPAYGNVSMRILVKPYRPPVTRLLKEGGPAARITKESKAGEMVIFSVDIGHISQYDLEEALRDDGRRRNLHWKLGREEAGNIVKLTYDDQVDNSEEGLEEVGDKTKETKEEYLLRKKEEHRRPSRYVISFRDRNEARRFVREWHRRPFPVRRIHNPGDEPIPIVNAEILW